MASLTLLWTTTESAMVISPNRRNLGWLRVSSGMGRRRDKSFMSNDRAKVAQNASISPENSGRSSMYRCPVTAWKW